MDPSFFGLEGEPFGKTKRADDPFLSEAHAGLTTELTAGLKAPHGITLLIGDEGAGKTTFIRSFASRLTDSTTVAYLPSTGPGLRHLLTEVIEQLGGTPAPGGDENVLLETLSSLARARAEHDRSTLVVLDEAHELPAKTIERLGRLFGDDPAEPSMLHVVLVGRPELLDRMNAANDRTILKHLVQVCRMDPIGAEESFQYIADRIQKVGGIVDRVFTEDALRLIVKRGGGLPAKIDAICGAALEKAADRGEPSVGADAVDLACMGVDGFSVEESSVSQYEPEPSNYVFADDEDDADEPMDIYSDRQQSGGASRGGMLGGVAGGQDSRKRLALWAVGAIAVIAGFAATMTGTGEDGELAATADSFDIAATSGAGGDATASLGLDAAAGDGTAALPTDPASVPKLVVKRAGAAKRKADAPKGKAGKKTGAQAAKQRNGNGRGAAAQQAPSARVHAAPTRAAAPRVVAPAAPRPEASRAAQQPAGAAAPTAARVIASAPTRPPVVAAPPAAAATERVAPVAAPRVAAPAPARTARPPARPAAQQRPPAAPERVAAAAPAPAAPRPLTVSNAPVVAVPRPVPSNPPVAVAKPKPSPAAPARVAPKQPVAVASVAAGPHYTVQLGAFSSRPNAEALLAKVRGVYPDGRIVVGNSGGKAVFRVVSGAFPSKSAADARAGALKKGGYSTFVKRVTP